MSRTPSMNRTDAENILGNAAEFMINSENRGIVRKWATSIGIPAVKAYALTNVELSNLYHERGRGAMGWDGVAPVRSDVAMPIAAAAQPVQPGSPEQALIDAIRAIQVDAARHAPIDKDAARAIAKEEAERVRDLLVQDIADALKPVEIITKLEVTGPNGIHTITGTVHNMTAMVIKIVALNHPVMMVGPAGCGKTTIGEHVAKALGFDFYITSTIIDTHELTGFVDGYGNYHSTPFRKAFENGGVWIADEIDAWDAAALLTANSALANGFSTFPDSTTPVYRHPDFRMIATANTFGHGADRVYIGRNELDAASLDRFATIAIDYDAALETEFCGGNTDWMNRVWQVRKAVAAKNIRHVVSSRAIIMGGVALAAGVPQDMVETMYLFKGMSATDRAKIGT